jgi:hypothetical protein
MEIVGWILWGIVLCFSIGGILFYVKQSQVGIMGQTIAVIVCMWILVAWSFFTPDLNKLHLIWLFPLTFILSFGSGLFLHQVGKWVILIGTIIVYCVILVIVSP